MYESPSRVQLVFCCKKSASHTFKKGVACGIALFTCFICKCIACDKHRLSVFIDLYIY